MTIERAYGKVEMLCDGEQCHESIGPYDNDDFDVLLSDAREAGWKTVKEDREWGHYCPDHR